VSKFRSRLTYANVMATIAVFVALGGTSVAAVSLRKNSVGSKQIKKGAVRNSDLRRNSVSSTKVRNRSLKALDFKAGQLPAGARGPTGAAGLKGATGSKGSTGSPGTARAYTTVDSAGTLVAGRSKNITQANIDPDTVVGTFCLTDLPFVPRSAVVAAQGVFNGGEPDVIASVYTAPDSMVSQGDCAGTVLVRTFDIGDNALKDRAFTIWFEN
jgi:hypothetical protein